MRAPSLLFDLDGTLTDPKPGITACIQYALTRLGRVPPAADALEWCIGPPLLGSLERLLADAPSSLAQEAVHLYRERYTLQGIFETAPYPGVDEMLGALQAAGYRLFVATSKPACYARRILDHFALSAPFEAVYGSEMDGTRSDKGELLAHLLAEQEIDPAGAVMIGDREHDLLAARQNGVLPVGVSYGYGSVEELTRAGASCVLESPEAVLRYFLTAACAGAVCPPPQTSP
jgi:phosphoglycolate phosphatase